MSAAFAYQFAILCVLATGAEPDAASVSAKLDANIAAKWTTRSVTAEGPADDATFHRRLWLDLAGRVPSALVVREFLGDSRSDRRTRLVEQMLASEDFAEHWGRVWTIRLTEDRPIRHEVHDGHVLQAYLRDSLLADKSYQQISRELVTGDGVQDSSGPANFLLRYGAKPEALAAAVSKNFMGATMQCAQCHDHVFAHWKKDDFRGLAAFFGRLKVMNSEDGALHSVVEAKKGEFQFMEPGAMPGPDGVVPMQTATPRLPVKGAAPMAATGHRRQVLATWLTSAENPWFSRHAVNATWQELFGAPLVPSLDDPEAALKGPNGDLLKLLSDDFSATGFNWKRLIRIIVLSQTYQRATGDYGNVPGGDHAADQARFEKQQTFAAFPVRPLSVDQLYHSINQATGNRAIEEAVVDNESARMESLDEEDEDDEEEQATSDRPVESLGNEAASLQRTLVLLTSPYGQEAVESGARIAMTINGRRIGRSHVEWLFLATVSRNPTKDELAKMLALVRSDQGARGLEDVLWVLLNSAEFNTNH